MSLVLFNTTGDWSFFIVTGLNLWGELHVCFWFLIVLAFSMLLISCSFSILLLKVWRSHVKVIARVVLHVQIQLECHLSLNYFFFVLLRVFFFYFRFLFHVPFVYFFLNCSVNMYLQMGRSYPFCSLIEDLIQLYWTFAGCCFVICPSREEADKAVTAYHNKRTLPGVCNPVCIFPGIFGCSVVNSNWSFYKFLLWGQKL